MVANPENGFSRDEALLPALDHDHMKVYTLLYAFLC